MSDYKTTGKLDAAGIAKLMNSDNIVLDLDDAKIASIETTCQALYEQDAQTCEDWRNEAKKLLEIAGMHDKSRTHIDPWQANTQLPDLIHAAMQFNAKTYPIYVKDGKVCSSKIEGQVTEEKRARAERIVDHMNWQLMFEMPEWASNLDKLLLILPIIGTVFKLTQYDQQLGRPTDTILMPEMVTVDNSPNNSDWARRISIDMVIGENARISNVVSGVWRDCELTPDEGTDESKKYTVVQMHGWYDLDDDGYDEPYIMTFAKTDWKLLSIIPRFYSDSLIMKYKKDNPKENYLIGIQAIDYITHYEYFPSPDGRALGMGIGHVVKELLKTRNTCLNQIQDAGTKINTSGGFIQKGAFRDDGTIIISPNEWKVMDGLMDGQDMTKALFPLPVNQPAAATFQVFEVCGQMIERIASTGDIATGSELPANTPAASVLASIEQSKIGQRVVLNRINRSMSKEFQIIYRLNGAYLTDKKYFTVGESENKEIAKEDYASGDFDIYPIADPNYSTRVERIMRAQSVMQMGIDSPIVKQEMLVELGYSEKEAKAIMEGDTQLKAMQLQGQQQIDGLAQQEKTLAQQEKTANAEAKRLELQLRLMEAESKARLENAQVKKTEAEALKTMADVEVMYNDAQKRQADQLLEELTALPAALPTSEELMNEQSIDSGEGEQGGLSPMVEQSSDQGNDGAIDQRVDEPQQPNEPPQPIDIGEGTLPIGQGAGIDGGVGLQEPTNGDMQEGS